MDLAEQIEAVLEKRGVTYSWHNGEVNCSCLMGTHADTHPSMWINPEKNVYYCFSCQASGIASSLLDLKIDEEDLRLMKYKKYIKNLEDIQENNSDITGRQEVFLPPNPKLPLPEEWRGIPRSFWEAIGAYYATIGRYKGRMILPSYSPFTKEVDAFDARLFPEYNEKYDITPLVPDAKYLRPAYVKTSHSVWMPKIFPDESAGYVVITEGVIDAISLLAMGYNAVANYGLAEFTPDKAAYLYAKGFHTVVMGLDLDSKGYAALPVIRESIRALGFAIGKPLPFVGAMVQLGLKDYNDYLQYKRTHNE